jgi:hypothetical protein
MRPSSSRILDSPSATRVIFGSPPHISQLLKHIKLFVLFFTLYSIDVVQFLHIRCNPVWVWAYMKCMHNKWSYIYFVFFQLGLRTWVIIRCINNVGTANMNEPPCSDWQWIQTTCRTCWEVCVDSMRPVNGERCDDCLHCAVDLKKEDEDVCLSFIFPKWYLGWVRSVLGCSLSCFQD